MPTEEMQGNFGKRWIPCEEEKYFSRWYPRPLPHILHFIVQCKEPIKNLLKPLFHQTNDTTVKIKSHIPVMQLRWLRSGVIQQIEMKGCGSDEETYSLYTVGCKSRPWRLKFDEDIIAHSGYPKSLEVTDGGFDIHEHEKSLIWWMRPR